MQVLGHRLYGPRIAAVILSICAVIYAVILIAATIDYYPMLGVLLPCGLLALACTPLAACIDLWRQVNPAPKRPSRPGIMALVMAVPAVFWSFAFLVVLTADGLTVLRNPDWLPMPFPIGIPAILSLWLMITFALLWWRGRRKAGGGYSTQRSGT